MDAMDRRLMLGAAGLAGVAAVARLAQAGPLNPPAGPVGPTGHSTDELWTKIARTDAGVAEPRIPVQSLPGSATAIHVISQPGSYYLTGNIQGVAGKHGIEISADDVSLDLCGFRIGGGSGSLHGVGTRESGVARLRLGNGTITGFGGSGVGGATAAASFIENLTVTDCAGTAAIEVGECALVRGCVLRRSPRGVKALNRALITDCIASDCSNHGFYLVGNGAANRCHATWCNVGIWAEFGGRIEQCFAANCQVGLQARFSASIERCVATDCFQDGIRVDGTDNTVCDNTASGSANLIVVVGTRNMVLSNRTRGAAGISIVPGNSHGPIVSVGGVGDISTVPGANHPCANFVS